MDASTDGIGLVGNPTQVQRVSDTELRVIRRFAAPARLVYKAWTTPALFVRWWMPSSLGIAILSCDMDVRTGGGYRLAFGDDAASAFVVHGRYLEVVPNQRIVWTNEEEADGAVTTVTFEEADGQTLLTYRDVYPSKAALETSRGAEEGLPEQFAQLDALLTAVET
jgi:uncharacterized protein YndB with AHSA1/START domain